MSNQNYTNWYRKFGNRFISDLIKPVLSDQKYLELPIDAVYHYVDYDGITLGPPADFHLFHDQTKKQIPVENILVLSGTLGVPKLIGNASQASQAFYHASRRYRMQKNMLVSFRDRMTPMVYNYSILPRVYRYSQNVLLPYFKWYNIFSTMLLNISSVVEKTNRQHYISLSGPKGIIPSLQQIQMGIDKGINQTTIKPFRDHNTFVLFELCKWFMDKTREESLFSKLPKNKIHLINFLYEEGGKWTVFNLGTLNSWYIPVNKSLDSNEYVITSKNRILGLQLVKRLLKLYMTLLEQRTITVKLSEEEANVVDESKPSNSIEVQGEKDIPGEAGYANDEDDDVDVSEMSANTPHEEIVIDIPEVPHFDEELSSDLTSEEFHALMKEQDLHLDRELANLEQIHSKIEFVKAKPGDIKIEEVLAGAHAVTVDSGVKEMCEKLAVTGMISPNESNKFTRLSDSYKQIKAPYSDLTLEQFMVIKPEDLAISSDQTVTDSKLILDESMSKSSLSQFDSKYIEKVLHKDYVNTVLSVQRSGIAVTGYKVDQVNDILGGYEEHTLKLTPVIGAPSTIRFKLPIVDKEGSYTSNGIKYVLRKQRGD